jgi:hypothetical protein
MKPTRAAPKTSKNMPERFSTKAELIPKLILHCKDEYEQVFGHPWSPDRIAQIAALTRRWRVEGDAWRVMYEFRKVAAKVLAFFESRGLDPNKPDNGHFNAYRLSKIVRQRRRFLESLVTDVRPVYERPGDRRHWLAWSMNFARPNAFVKLPEGLPYGRALSHRELAIVSILMTEGREVDFKRGMTVGAAIEQELRRMARAAERAPLRGKRRRTGGLTANEERDAAAPSE